MNRDAPRGPDSRGAATGLARGRFGAWVGGGAAPLARLQPRGAVRTATDRARTLRRGTNGPRGPLDRGLCRYHPRPVRRSWGIVGDVLGVPTPITPTVYGRRTVRRGRRGPADRSEPTTLGTWPVPDPRPLGKGCMYHANSPGRHVAGRAASPAHDRTGDVVKGLTMRGYALRSAHRARARAILPATSRSGTGSSVRSTSYPAARAEP